MNGDRRDITSLCEIQVRSPVSRTKVRTTNLLPVDWLLAQRHQRNSALNKDGNRIDFIIQDSRLFASIRVHSLSEPKWKVPIPSQVESEGRFLNPMVCSHSPAGVAPGGLRKAEATELAPEAVGAGPSDSD